MFSSRDVWSIMRSLFITVDPLLKPFIKMLLILWHHNHFSAYIRCPDNSHLFLWYRDSLDYDADEKQITALLREDNVAVEIFDTIYSVGLKFWDTFFYFC